MKTIMSDPVVADGDVDDVNVNININTSPGEFVRQKQTLHEAPTNKVSILKVCFLCLIFQKIVEKIVQ